MVNIVSTLASPTDTTSVNRTQKDGTKVAVPCPRSVALYNEYMGGVDNGEQLRGSYPVRLKCRKNYKYVFGFGFAYLAHMTCDLIPHWTTNKFIAEQVIGDHCSRKRACRPRKRPHPSNTANTPKPFRAYVMIHAGWVWPELFHGSRSIRIQLGNAQRRVDISTL